MNTFGQGFKFGLASGLFNNLFGGCSMFGFNGYMANPFCNYSFSPMFFTPAFSFNSFMPYASPLNSMPTFSFGSISSYLSPVDTFTFSNNQNLNPYSLYSSNYYGNNFGLLTQQTCTDFSLNSLPSIKASNIVSEPIVTLYPPEPPKNSFSDNILVEKPDSKPKVTSKTNIDYSIENLKAKWKKKKPNLNLSDEFYNKIIKISKDIKCDPNDLMGIINLETRGTFSPSEKNPISGATGLIQFLPDVTKEEIKNGIPQDMVKRVGKRISELEKMSAEEQLDYVEKYLKSHIKEKKIKDKIDGATLYSIVFWPKAANKDDSYIIAKQGSRVYEQNPLLDKDKNPKSENNTITKRDLGERLKEFIA